MSDGIAGKNGGGKKRGKRTFDVGFTSGLHVCVRRQFKGSFTLGVLKKDVNLALLNQDGCTAEVVVGVFESDLEPNDRGLAAEEEEKKKPMERRTERERNSARKF